MGIIFFVIDVIKKFIENKNCKDREKYIIIDWI